MICEASVAGATEAFYFCLIASDGEVFDAEALPEPGKSRIGFVRLGSRASRQLEVMKQKTEAVSIGETSSNELSLRDFLVCPTLSISLARGWDGKRAVFFSAEGGIVKELSPDDPVPINSSDKLRVAFVGGGKPDPKILYSAGNLRWEETEVVCSELPLRGEAHLRRILRKLDGDRVDWDEEKLKLLVADCKKTGERKKTELTCPADETHGKHPARESLFCWCGALLVSREDTRREELPMSYSDKICFPIRSGNVDIGEVFPCEWNTGNDAYAVHDENGERWLALNLFKKA
jgi:hypothetical protein